MRATTAMRGVGAGDDNGAGGVTSLLPDLDWKPRASGSRMEKAGAARTFIYFGTFSPD
jgi:hypothetical protein